jgi:ergothioneine biosynthesis protein EgtB
MLGSCASRHTKSNKRKVFITNFNQIAMKNIAHSANFTGADALSSKPGVTKVTFASRLTAVRNQSTLLVAHLSPEDCQIQSMPDASPTKWHLAHTTWFFETFVLEKFEANFRPHNESFRVLFNSYYNGIGAKHPRAQRGLISRPNLQEVLAYRQAVNERVQAVLAALPEHAELLALLELGIHHEQQHQELMLTDIKHMLSCNPAPSAFAKRWPLSRVSPSPMQWLGFAGGLVHTGQVAQNASFCFDNETPEHKAWLEPFELASSPVTYGDYLAFMHDGGYQRPELWLSMGWDWVHSASVGPRSMPLYWERDSQATHGYSTFTLQGRVPVDVHTTVCHLSYFEADAYARWAGAYSTDTRWAGARLPTEHEWEHAALSGQAVEAISTGNFVESQGYHPLPLKAPGAGLQQMFGDVWEWTASNYNPYPGYHAWEGAVGEYNGKFMCNQFVLRGGSCATPQSHIRATYRNFFPPDAQWQFSGLRLARDC